MFYALIFIPILHFIFFSYFIIILFFLKFLLFFIFLFYEMWKKSFSFFVYTTWGSREENNWQRPLIQFSVERVVKPPTTRKSGVTSTSLAKNSINGLRYRHNTQGCLCLAEVMCRLRKKGWVGLANPLTGRLANHVGGAN